MWTNELVTVITSTIIIVLFQVMIIIYGKNVTIGHYTSLEYYVSLLHQYMSIYVYIYIYIYIYHTLVCTTQGRVVRSLKVDVGVWSEFFKSMTQLTNQYLSWKTACRQHRKEKVVSHHANS